MNHRSFYNRIIFAVLQFWSVKMQPSATNLIIVCYIRVVKCKHRYSSRTHRPASNRYKLFGGTADMSTCDITLSPHESTGSSRPAPRVRPAEPSPGANSTAKTITSTILTKARSAPEDAASIERFSKRVRSIEPIRRLSHDGDRETGRTPGVARAHHHRRRIT
jgi:hypothetical protein